MKKLTCILLIVTMMLGFSGSLFADGGKTAHDYVIEINQLDRLRHVMLRKYGEMKKTEENTKQIVGAIVSLDIMIVKLYVAKAETEGNVGYEIVRTDNIK